MIVFRVLTKKWFHKNVFDVSWIDQWSVRIDSSLQVFYKIRRFWSCITRLALQLIICTSFLHILLVHKMRSLDLSSLFISTLLLLNQRRHFDAFDGILQVHQFNNYKLKKDPATQQHEAIWYGQVYQRHWRLLQFPDKTWLALAFLIVCSDHKIVPWWHSLQQVLLST